MQLNQGYVLVSAVAVVELFARFERQVSAGVCERVIPPADILLSDFVQDVFVIVRFQKHCVQLVSRGIFDFAGVCGVQDLESVKVDEEVSHVNIVTPHDRGDGDVSSLELEGLFTNHLVNGNCLSNI